MAEVLSRYCAGLFFRRWIHFQTVEEEISAADFRGRARRLPRRVLPARPAGAAAGRLRGHRGRQGHLGPAQVAFRWMQRLLLCPDPPPEQVPAAAGRNPFRVQVTGTVSPKGELPFIIAVMEGRVEIQYVTTYIHMKHIFICMAYIGDFILSLIVAAQE